MAKCLNYCCFCFPLGPGCVIVGSFLIFRGCFYFALPFECRLDFSFDDELCTIVLGSKAAIYTPVSILSVIMGSWTLYGARKRKPYQLKLCAVVIAVSAILVFCMSLLWNLIVDSMLEELLRFSFLSVDFVLCIYFSLILWSYASECYSSIDIMCNV